MKIHEYQAKQIMRDNNIPVPNGGMADTAAAAGKVAAGISGSSFVVKAQVHAGGRGKGGGIKTAATPAEVEKIAQAMIGMRLITPQTGAEGKQVNKVLVEEGVNIAREIYLGITVDRANECPVIIASREGGMEIEELARTSPEKIIKERVDFSVGLRAFQINKIVFALDLNAGLRKPMTQLIAALYKIFVEKDCSLVEINPLVITKERQPLALDGKINFDDNALYKHKEMAELRDVLEEEPLEVEAARHNLNYIKLDGNVGCMVNGAGLAMATMDVIKLAGGEPANFLDVGGGATSDMVKNGIKILVSDPKVKAVFINIFGGIMDCNIVAQGVVAAAKETGLSLPLVVRLEGNNVEAAKATLAASGLNIVSAAGMDDGALKIVKAVN